MPVALGLNNNLSPNNRSCVECDDILYEEFPPASRLQDFCKEAMEIGGIWPELAGR